MKCHVLFNFGFSPGKHALQGPTIVGLTDTPEVEQFQTSLHRFTRRCKLASIEGGMALVPHGTR